MDIEKIDINKIPDLLKSRINPIFKDYLTHMKIIVESIEIVEECIYDLEEEIKGIPNKSVVYNNINIIACNLQYLLNMEYIKDTDDSKISIITKSLKDMADCIHDQIFSEDPSYGKIIKFPVLH